MKLFLLLLLVLGNFSAHCEEILFKKSQIGKRSSYNSNFLCGNNNEIFFLNTRGVLYSRSTGALYNFNFKENKKYNKNIALFCNDNHNIFIINGSALFAFDTDTRKILWKSESEYEFTQQLVTDKNHVFVATNSGLIEALDKKNGNLEWLYQTAPGMNFSERIEYKNYPKIFLLGENLVSMLTNGMIVGFNNINGARQVAKIFDYAKYTEVPQYALLGKPNPDSEYFLMQSNDRAFLFSLKKQTSVLDIPHVNFYDAVYKKNIIYALTREKLFIIENLKYKFIPLNGCKPAKKSKIMQIFDLSSGIIIDCGNKKSFSINTSELIHKSVIGTYNKKPIFWSNGQIALG